MSHTPESDTGFGNEPLTTPYENGRMLAEDELTYESQDAHFAAVDRRVDSGIDNYYSAAAKESYDSRSYEAQSTEDELDILFNAQTQSQSPSVGVFVSLEDRARAVENLMDGINAQNQTSGAKRSNATAKYGSNAEKVMLGMERNATYYRQSRSRMVESLAKTAALRAIGFDDSEALASQEYINRLVSKASGVGPVAVRLRKRQKAITRRTADKVFEQE